MANCHWTLLVAEPLNTTRGVSICPDAVMVTATVTRIVDDVDNLTCTDQVPNISIVVFACIEKEIKGRFNVNILGQAHWFLQMRIHHHANGCISFDQHRFLLNLLQRFCRDDAPTGKPKLRDTPAPPDYVFTTENRPTTSADHARIRETYGDLDFRSCLCTILYLAYSTRADILFIVCKLAKACIDPGIKDFDALYWLLGYLRKYPNYGVCFYPTAATSPVNKLLADNNVPYNDIIVFSNASCIRERAQSCLNIITIFFV